MSETITTGADTGTVFAFGSDRVSTPECDDPVSCPANAAGYHPESGDESSTIANLYDGILREWHADDDREFDLNEYWRTAHDGIIPEDIAREAWFEAINRLNTREAVNLGQEIATENGWEDDDVE